MCLTVTDKFVYTLLHSDWLMVCLLQSWAMCLTVADKFVYTLLHSDWLIGCLHYGAMCLTVADKFVYIFLSLTVEHMVPYPK